MKTWPCWITYLVSVKDATTNFDRFLRVKKHLMLLNFCWLLRRCIVHWTMNNCSSVLHSLPWSRLQLLQSVLNSAANLIRGLGRFYHITHVFIDLYWLSYPQRIFTRYFAYVQMLERFGLGPCSFSSLCWHFCCSGSFWFEIRSSKWSCCAGTQDIVGFYRFFAVAGPKCRNKLSGGLGDLSVSHETFARHLKTYLFRDGFSD